MFGVIRSFAISVVLVSAMLACESKPAQQAAPQPDGGAAIADIGQGDAVQGDATDATASWDIPKPSAACEPDNPKPWEEWVIANHPALRDLAAPPPEVDAQCKPIYDKSCTTVCDCKFMNYECGLVGANWQVPWQIVPYTGGNKAEGCWQNTCGVTQWPKVGINHLECIQGKCYATGTNALDKLPAGAK